MGEVAKKSSAQAPPATPVATAAAARRATSRPSKAGAAKSSQPITAAWKVTCWRSGSSPADRRRRGRLERRHRRLDLPVAPDEDHVEHDEQDQTRGEPGRGRQAGREPGDGQAGTGDQHHARRVRRKGVRPEPGQQVERHHDERRQPGEAPAARPAGPGGEQRRGDSGERGEEVGSAGRLCDDDADHECRRRDHQPQRPRGEQPRRPPGDQDERRLDHHEHGV